MTRRSGKTEDLSAQVALYKEIARQNYEEWKAEAETYRIMFTAADRQRNDLLARVDAVQDILFYYRMHPMSYADTDDLASDIEAVLSGDLS